MLLIQSLGSEELGQRKTEYSTNSKTETFCIYNTENVFWKLIQDLEDVHH